ncbi:MAG: hypothetical protein ACLVB5_08125 [Christensenellales bacterium]
MEKAICTLFFPKISRKICVSPKFTAVSRKTKTTENLQEIRNKNAGKTG